MQNTKKESRGAAKISKSLAIQSAARTKAIQLLCNNGNDGRHYPSLYCNEMDLSPLPLTESWAREANLAAVPRQPGIIVGPPPPFIHNISLAINSKSKAALRYGGFYPS
jgi:hypothetical protein